MQQHERPRTTSLLVLEGRASQLFSTDITAHCIHTAQGSQFRRCRLAPDCLSRAPVWAWQSKESG
jgi:hypothetical protein